MTMAQKLTPPERGLGWDIATLNVWAAGAAPAWWANAALRDYLTVSHRVVPILDVEAEAVRQFGAGSPTKSAIGRYWKRLDQLLGGPARDHSPELVELAAKNGVAVVVLKAELAVNALTDHQRLALAIQIAVQITDDDLGLSMTRLGTVATSTGAELLAQRVRRSDQA